MSLEQLWTKLEEEKSLTTREENEFTEKAIKYYLEWNGFRRIERLMHVSHVSVINWVKKAAEGIRKSRKFKQKKN